MSTVLEPVHRLTGDCEKCPLSNEYLVPGSGVGGGLALVGEAPGTHEVRNKIPFTGPTGKLIRMVLTAVGMDPDQAYWTNAALCRPPGNKTPPIEALSACHDRLVDELAVQKPQKMLIMGASALTSLMGAQVQQSIFKWYGKGMWINGVYSVPTFHPAAVLREADLFRDMVEDLQKLLDNDGPMQQPEVEVWIPLDVREFRRMAKKLSGSTVLSCDTETTGFDFLRDKLISTAFGTLYDDLHGVSLVVGSTLAEDPEVKQGMWDLMHGDSVTVFHNAKFDLEFLGQYFGKHVRPSKLSDTMVMHYLLDERSSGRSEIHSLKTLARRYFDADYKTLDFNAFFSGKGGTLEDLYNYQALDCYYTRRLHDVLLGKLTEESENLVSAYENVLIPASRTLTEIETTGALLDIPYLYGLELEYEDRLLDMQANLEVLVEKTSGVKFFNSNSSKQVGDYLRKTLGLTADKIETGKVHLKEMMPKVKDPDVREVLRSILDYRNQSKFLGTYIRGYLMRAHEDNRIRTNFALGGTVTGRLASRNPNLQNIPHHGIGDYDAAALERADKLRRAFIVPEGFSFVEADFSQVELRVAAHLSRDPLMMQIFHDGRDIHTEAAINMMGKPAEEITGPERRMAKFINFGVVYGRSAAAVAGGNEMQNIQQAGGTRWSVKQAQTFIDKFFAGFPDLDRWLREQRAAPHKQHYVESPTGRRRRFPLLLPGDPEYERQALNFPIQSLASDICLDAMIRLHQGLKDGARILFTVHDSICFEVPNENLDKTIDQIRHTMEEVSLLKLEVPIKVDIKVGTRWNELKEVKGD